MAVFNVKLTVKPKVRFVCLFNFYGLTLIFKRETTPGEKGFPLLLTAILMISNEKIYRSINFKQIYFYFLVKGSVTEFLRIILKNLLEIKTNSFTIKSQKGIYIHTCIHTYIHIFKFKK